MSVFDSGTPESNRTSDDDNTEAQVNGRSRCIMESLHQHLRGPAFNTVVIFTILIVSAVSSRD